MLSFFSYFIFFRIAFFNTNSSSLSSNELPNSVCYTAISLLIYFNARKEQIIDDFNDTSTSIRSISSIQMVIEIHYNDNFFYRF
ncbi:unnamed protein product [Rotaria magnacalcarata]